MCAQRFCSVSKRSFVLECMEEIIVRGSCIHVQLLLLSCYFCAACVVFSLLDVASVHLTDGHKMLQESLTLLSVLTQLLIITS